MTLILNGPAKRKKKKEKQTNKKQLRKKPHTYTEIKHTW